MGEGSLPESFDGLQTLLVFVHMQFLAKKVVDDEVFYRILTLLHENRCFSWKTN